MSRSRNLIVGAFIAMFASLASTANALELFGFTVFEGESRSDEQVVDLLDPQTYKLHTQINADDDLTAALLAVSDLWQQRDSAVSGSAGLIALARSDYAHLLGVLYNHGYYGGAISITAGGREVAGLSLTANLQQNVNVRIDVKTGPRFRFGRTELVNGPKGFDPQVVDPQRPFEKGQIAHAEVISATGDEAIAAWRQLGHAKARVVDQQIIADHPSDELDVVIVLEPGKKAKFGNVRITGESVTSKKFIRYMADISEGKPFRTKRLARARKRLSNLGIFRSVVIEEGAEIDADGELPISIDVRERLKRRYGIGATLSNIEGLGLEAYWLHRNRFGHAERLRFDARVNGIGERAGWQEYDYLFGTSFTRPGIFSPDNRFESGVQIEQLVLETYRERSVDLTFGLVRNFDDRLEGSVFFDLEYSRIRDDLGEQEFLTLGLPIKAEYDQRNDDKDPSGGYFIGGEIVPFTELRFHNSAVRTSFEGRKYLDFGTYGKTVFAVRGKIGSVFGGDLSELPANQLFFAGGGGSVRGYGFRSIGIETEGITTGARSSIELSGELRYRVNDWFGMTGFVDAGSVSAETIPFDDFDPHVGVGIGGRIYTSLGPIRFDVAVPLDRRENDAAVAFYIGLGQSF